MIQTVLLFNHRYYKSNKNVHKMKKIGNFRNKSFTFIVLIFLLINTIFIIYSCTKEAEIFNTNYQYNPTPYDLNSPPYFPTNLNIPEDNPLTEEGVELGRYLFYDGRLRGYSGTNPDSLMSCGTCHLQEYGFKCGLNHPKFPEGQTYGITGLKTPHFIMPLINLVYNNEGYLWNGSLSPRNPNPDMQSLESFVSVVIEDPYEMGGSIEKAVQVISSIDFYPPMFEAAFGTPEVNIDRIEKAVAQFVRALVSFDSKFDRYLRGEEQLTDSELRGYILFTTEEGADCFHCHGGAGTPLFTTILFYNNAIDSVFTDPADRFGFTRVLADKGAYRAPSLRNIEFTAPYMHDGRFKNLDEVINFYSEELVVSPYVHSLMHKIDDGGAMLTPKEKTDLKNFLLTLSDHNFINNPKFSKPEELP